MLVAVQLPVAGLYAPPVFKPLKKTSSIPLQMIISVPVQTAVCPIRADGAPFVPVLVQLSVLGLYFPPMLGIGIA
jgi:hypothetical protein